MTEYSFYSGAFTEYATFFVYASDVFLILALFFWLISSKNAIKLVDLNKLKTSSFPPRCREQACLFPTEKLQHSEDSIKWVDVFNKNKIWKYLLLFILVLGLNLMFKRDYFEISIFQFFKSIELILLVLFVYFNLNRTKWLFNSLLVLSISGFTQGVIAIFQFTGQQSFFRSELLRKLTGESLIGADIPGVAKFVLEGQKIVRSYGTFPHPNILGGFLIFTTLVTIFLYLESKNGYLSSKITSFRLFGQYNNTKSNISQGVIHSLFWIIVIFVQISALFLTFSRVSWIGFILAIIILLLFYCVIYFSIVSRETIDKLSSSPDRDNLSNDIQNLKNSPLERGGRGADGVCEESQDYSLKLKDRSVFLSSLSAFVFRFFRNIIIEFKELFVILLLLIFLVVSNFSLIQARIGSDLLGDNYLPNNYALSDRLFYNNVSRETISNNFLFGSGLGTSIFQIDEHLEKNNIKQKLESWQYQPAHNIYFLIASEIGLIGLLIFLLFIGCAISDSIRQILKPTSISYKDAIQIVSRETIEYNSSPDKGRLGASSFIKGGKGDFEESQDCNSNTSFNDQINQKISLLSKIKRLFHFFAGWRIQSKIKIVSRETINKLSSSPDKDNLSNDIQNLKNSPLERGGRGADGVCGKSQDCNLKLKIRNIFSFFLNTFALRRFKTPQPPRSAIAQGRLLSGGISSSPDKGRACPERLPNGLGGVFEESQDYNINVDKIVSRETIFNNKLNYFLLAIFLTFLFIGLFDHYFWTLQQGRLMFWLVLGLILANCKNK